MHKFSIGVFFSIGKHSCDVLDSYIFSEHKNNSKNTFSMFK